MFGGWADQPTIPSTGRTTFGLLHDTYSMQQQRRSSSSCIGYGIEPSLVLTRSSQLANGRKLLIIVMVITQFVALLTLSLLLADGGLSASGDKIGFGAANKQAFEHWVYLRLSESDRLNFGATEMDLSIGGFLLQLHRCFLVWNQIKSVHVKVGTFMGCVGLAHPHLQFQGC